MNKKAINHMTKEMKVLFFMELPRIVVVILSQHLYNIISSQMYDVIKKLHGVSIHRNTR